MVGPRKQKQFKEFPHVRKTIQGHNQLMGPIYSCLIPGNLTSAECIPKYLDRVWQEML